MRGSVVGRPVSASVHGWLLLLPAAVLLVIFTHYPTVATLYHSFFSTSKPGRPTAWIGLDNYRNMVEDPVFWQVLANNLWYALAILLAVSVNPKPGPRGVPRLAFFTPTVLPMSALANTWLFCPTRRYGLHE